MIIKPGIREVQGVDPDGRVTGTTRICGYDKHHGHGELLPNVIGEHEITSIFWRDGYAQVVVRGDVPRDLFKKLVVKLPDSDFVLDTQNAKVFSATAHGDSCWVWLPSNPGQHQSDDGFVVEVL